MNGGAQAKEKGWRDSLGLSQTKSKTKSHAKAKAKGHAKNKGDAKFNWRAAAGQAAAAADNHLNG